ncbi:shikimate dehydrogenase [Alkalilimnicola ehrlichii]|uniref:Shikimate dehydrogenase (NADP(+)) n=1 Tax=Alkalilimnicola ehrlichii TaxID=351052 RepID=A0A3E0X4V6_9GAMM|nr:shikimate dehydrogenase [Alkalilimnicola ehrlichii]RFA31149.1 shikimate dehydrogenase [Alkalilimnicola ehrlichii]RFA39566.1 shikimate dehydrogenase [Alkalilimnicola ehrlichii]
MSDRYAVMGNPVAHSKSPQIHQLFAEQTGQALSYEKILVPLGEFQQALEAFRDSGGKGLNITVPFKQDAREVAHSVSERARAGGAVNTLLFESNGRIFGDNTDGTGLVRDLRNNHAVHLAGKRILILGAGGAVRGVLPALLGELPESITIANRTETKAIELAALFNAKLPVKGCGYDALGERFDIVINGTSAGLTGELPPLPHTLLREGASCYDMVYGDIPTVFQQWALEHDAALALDGLGMLVEQAAESFFIWRGISPDTAPVIEVLRQAMAD